VWVTVISSNTTGNTFSVRHTWPTLGLAAMIIAAGPSTQANQVPSVLMISPSS
jgi:hypothetical protein